MLDNNAEAYFRLKLLNQVHSQVHGRITIKIDDTYLDDAEPLLRVLIFISCFILGEVVWILVRGFLTSFT